MKGGDSVNADRVFAIVKNCLVNEWQNLPEPIASERVLEMINVALNTAKSIIESTTDTQE